MQAPSCPHNNPDSLCVAQEDTNGGHKRNAAARVPHCSLAWRDKVLSSDCNRTLTSSYEFAAQVIHEMRCQDEPALFSARMVVPRRQRSADVFQILQGFLPFLTCNGVGRHTNHSKCQGQCSKRYLLELHQNVLRSQVIKRHMASCPMASCVKGVATSQIQAPAMVRFSPELAAWSSLHGQIKRLLDAQFGLQVRQVATLHAFNSG